ncbi:MAG: hypothetical protein A2913_02290 [Parcubacteria group bacterium RIFCSPLOWO2_01_FULL_40_65]|nr:MAG: hypothetical protein A2734_00470 [Parcubacteria group bacterium RIFCSPHIGHO2_01_FULL_40_30]OHB19603.1 MAG: hypothetical protein A3D40_01955 [Parcubacteria group bacterium RIFCSPHIGHO2_02_FULL_40_12]OHB21952.1 MAG: hypothetical protein A2913_02290 [Parcubacteria group bacterium RIFCSPLOWO2_01_FULL_40_65]OHB23749.1 MAG: hypothetical protein A3I22_01020 [Parcubacteria group bacterium RIFCSPLOWO2_02_FULL_40_12]OHB24336.1 MAG: hypothetical protein A3F96_00640 [Parcubacteria group bacterium R
MTSILDLKDPKNHKVNNNHLFNDIFDENPADGGGAGMMPIEPTLKSENEHHLNDFLNKIDNDKEIPDNPGIMQDATGLPAIFTSYSWTLPDRHHELISHAWRKAVIVILVGMAFLALFWQGSVLTAMTFFALALVTSMHFWREIQYHKYEVHPHGIVISDKFYHYHDLDSFWIHYHPEGYHELSLCTGKLLNHYIKIPLLGQDPLEVRDALAMYLPEERHEEGLEDLLRRKLGL